MTVIAVLGSFTPGFRAAIAASFQVLIQIKTWKWKPEEFRAAREEVLGELGIEDSHAAEIQVIGGAIPAEGMRELYQRAWLFVKNANREGWSMPCSEAIACGTPVAATAIEPLLSHLGEDTRWFSAGDLGELGRILHSEYARFRSRLRLAQRHDASVTTKLIEGALIRLTA